MSSSPTLLKTEENERTYITRCQCRGHLLEVTIFKDDIDMGFNGQVYFSMEPRMVAYDLRHRFRILWCMLWRGIGHGNEIVLDADHAIELGKVLQEEGRRVKSTQNSGQSGYQLKEITNA